MTSFSIDAFSRPVSRDFPLPSSNYLVDVGFNLIRNHRRITALGNNPDLSTAAVEDVWTGGGIYPWMSTSTSLEVVSSSAADGVAGTGARTVLISGLNSSWDEISATVTLNGTTPVSIPTQFYRIQSALIMSAGSSKVNEGTLTVRDSGGGTTRAIIPIGYGTTRQSQFTVPAGYTLQVVSLVLSINRPTSTRDATVATFVQSSTGFYRLPLELSVDGNTYRHDGIPGITLPEKTDFGLRATYCSVNNTDLTSGWLGILRKNTGT